MHKELDNKNEIINKLNIDNDLNNKNGGILYHRSYTSKHEKN